MSVVVEIYVECNECRTRLFVGFGTDVKIDTARNAAREAQWLCLTSKESPTGRGVDLCPQCKRTAKG